VRAGIDPVDIDLVVCATSTPDRTFPATGVRIQAGLGVTKGVKVEELYREIRALRIYEGATEVQKIVIARELLRERAGKPALAAE